MANNIIINNPLISGMILPYYCRYTHGAGAPPSFPGNPDYTQGSIVSRASVLARDDRGEPALTTPDAIVAYVHPLYNTLVVGLGRDIMTLAQFRDIYDRLIEVI